MSINPKHIASYDTDYNFRFRYETLRSLLNKNGNALQILSDLEADLNHMHHYDKRIKRPIQRLITQSLLMAQELNLMTGENHSDLYGVISRIRNQTDKLFSEQPPDVDQPFVLRLDNPDDPDPLLIGGKAFNVWHLGKHFSNLTPPGFVVTTAAYNRIIEDNNLHNRIRILLNNLDVTEDEAQFKSRTQTIRRLIRESTVHGEIEDAIKEQVGLFDQAFPEDLWAVRSSAVCEDGSHSFAGQFDSELQIKQENIISAYLHVLAGRFTDRAVKYRIHNNFREVDTPMAVLFMPMVDSVAAGVVHSTDIKDPDSNTMVVSAMPGLANRMVKGEDQADTVMVSKGLSPEITGVPPAKGDGGNTRTADYISNEKLFEISELVGQAVTEFGHELDIEWAVDRNNNVRFLQARRLNIPRLDNPEISKLSPQKNTLPIIEAGITIFPGRAEGPITFLSPGADLSKVPEGAIVVVEHPRPVLSSILPKIAALLVVEGNPVGHLATLIREFSVPCIFRLGKNEKILHGKNIISVNATKRTVYAGMRWPGIRERVLARIAAGNRHQEKSGPLYDLVLALNLLDPDAGSFKAESCLSVHDTLRFMHEMSVRSMFDFGDKQNRGWNKKSKKLTTGLPIKLQLIDLDGSVIGSSNNVPPENVESTPFKALWRGIMDKRLFWPERWKKMMRGMPADFQEAVLGGNRGPRRASDKNYAIIAKDYMNLNARFAYHYAMVDAMVGPGTEHNYVHLRFRGGGAGDENKKRRARFLEQVLRPSGFGVDRTGDLVTAWFRHYPQNDSENALEFLGRLMICARQLDVALRSDRSVKLYADYFLQEQFKRFV